MRPLVLEEIVARDHYGEQRPAYRDAVIAYKRRRRLALGDKVTLLFEDRETLRFQVQEMLWIEAIHEPAKIQDELDVYNELMPGGALNPSICSRATRHSTPSFASPSAAVMS